MRRTLAVLAICLLLFLGSRVATAQTWHQGRTGAFSVTTDAGDSTARDLLSRFEQERVIIAQILHKQKIAPPGVVQVIAVRDPQSLTKAVPQFPAELLSRGAITFDGMERSSLIFIAPQQSESASRAVASILLATNYPHTPRWFDHGFARYVGSMQIVKEQVELGRPPSDDKRGEGWIRLIAVMTNNGENNAQWQHESWLLVHWLITNGRLDEAGKYFYLTMNQHLPAHEAVKQAFGEDEATLDRDLQAYDAEVSKHVQTLPLANLQTWSQFPVNKVTAVDGSIAIATALLDDRDRQDSQPTAMKALSGIMHNLPDNAAVQRSLAYGYLMQHDAVNAVEHARRAIALADSDALMHYILAVGQNGGDMSAIRARMAEVRFGNELNSAIRLNPDFAPAYELRGLALVSGDKLELGLKDLGRAAGLRPRNDEYLLHLGQAQAASGDWDNARVLFAMAKESSDADVAQAAAEELKTGKRLKQEQKHWKEQGVASATYQDMTDPKWKPTPEMEARAKADDNEKPNAGPDTRPVKHLDGELVSVDCTNDPGAVLTVSSRGNAWKMKVADRKSVLLIGPDTFSCTWKQKKVSVNYKASGGITGEVVSLEID
jgi:tetratricopeptide (TPR) repeat protein